MEFGSIHHVIEGRLLRNKMPGLALLADGLHATGHDLGFYSLVYDKRRLCMAQTRNSSTQID